MFDIVNILCCSKSHNPRSTQNIVRFILVLCILFDVSYYMYNFITFVFSLKVSESFFNKIVSCIECPRSATIKQATFPRHPEKTETPSHRNNKITSRKKQKTNEPINAHLTIG